MSNDIFLYAGEPNPNDIVLRDPTVLAGGGTTTYSYTGTGGIAFAGVATVTKSKTFTASGGIVFAGAGALAKGKAITASGGIQFVGAAPASFVSSAPPATGSGGGTGFFWSKRAYVGRRTFVFEHAGRGGPKFGGGSETNFEPDSTDEVAVVLMLLELIDD